MTQQKPTISQGFITLTRVILSNDEFREDAPLSKRDAYIELVLMASFTEETVMNGGEEIPLHRGQVLVSEKLLMDRFHWGNTRVRNFLDWLVREGIATLDKVSNKVSHKASRKAVLTLVNYGIDSYRKVSDKVFGKVSDKVSFENERKEAKESKSNCYSDTSDTVYPSYPSNSLEINKNKNNTVTDDFDEFWAAYPKKVDKYVARQSYTKARQKATADEIMQGLNRYKQYLSAEQTEKQFIANASTWLNQHRWENQYEIEKKPDTAPVKKTQFHNFEERHTDYETLFESITKRA